MCLARPGKVVDAKEDSVVVDYENERRVASTKLIQPEVGSYVIVNAGFVIQVIDENEAIESINAWKKLEDG